MGDKKKAPPSNRKAAVAKAGKRRGAITPPPSPNHSPERRIARARGEQQFYAPIGEHEMVWDPTRQRVIRSCKWAPPAAKGMGACAAEQEAAA